MDNNKRNYGIDLLRFVSMFFVVTLHVLGRGGVLEESSGINAHVGWIMEVIAICAVDCYAMISGYVGYSSNAKFYKYSRIVAIWLQIVFYNIILTLISVFFEYSAFSPNLIVKCFLPFSTNEYWYFTSYTILFFMIPLLNIMLRHVSKEQLTYSVIIMVSFFSVYATLSLPFSDSLQLANGYSPIWLIILYIIGGWLKKCDIPLRLKNKWGVVILIGLILITWGSKMIIDIGLSEFSYYDTLLISYISPTVVGMAILYICIFSKMKLKGEIISMLQLFTPCVFGIYLLQENPIIRDLVITNKYAIIGTLPLIYMIVLVIAVAMIWFVMGIVIEYFRLQLFHLFGIPEKVQLVENKLKNKLRKTYQNRSGAL